MPWPRDDGCRRRGRIRQADATPRGPQWMRPSPVRAIRRRARAQGAPAIAYSPRARSRRRLDAAPRPRVRPAGQGRPGAGRPSCPRRRSRPGCAGHVEARRLPGPGPEALHAAHHVDVGRGPAAILAALDRDGPAAQDRERARRRRGSRSWLPAPRRLPPGSGRPASRRAPGPADRRAGRHSRISRSRAARSEPDREAVAVDHDLRSEDLPGAAAPRVGALALGERPQRQGVLPAEIVPVGHRQGQGDHARAAGTGRASPDRPTGRRRSPGW